MSTALSGSRTLRSRTSRIRYEAMRMKAISFQRLCTIASLSDRSCEAVPPTATVVEWRAAIGAPARSIPATVAEAAFDSGSFLKYASNRNACLSDAATTGPVRATPGSVATFLRSSAAAAAFPVTMCAGPLAPGPTARATRSVAMCVGELAGSSVSPRVKTLIDRTGEARMSMIAVPTTSEMTGRRSTPFVQLRQKSPPASPPVVHGVGIRSRSMLCPTTFRKAGSSVSEAVTATATTRIAPTAIDRIAFKSSRKRPASDTITVAPLNSTALPDVLSAMPSASSLSAPRWSSVRKRLTMKSE